jgi:multicomponent Na+:H+ antiporter subunit D
LLRAGTVNGSQLGGLYKSMPWTTGFCIVGAASISAFPLFSGFVSKSLILTAVASEGYFWVWLILLFASAGVFHHSGIKIPYFAFFAHDSGIRCKEAPRNMLIAMGITAFMCVGIGVFPSALYALLPYDIDYAPYSAAHVLSQLQLLMFSALAFSVLMWYGIYPPELRSVNLDTDWFYRRLGKSFARGLLVGLDGVVKDVTTLGMALVRGVTSQVGALFARDGLLTSERNTNVMVTLVTAVLLVSLLLFSGLVNI